MKSVKIDGMRNHLINGLIGRTGIFHNQSKSTNKNIMQGDATFDKRLPMIECQYNK